MTHYEELNHWIKKWQPKKQNSDVCTSFWNNRAERFNKEIVLNPQTSDDIIELLIKKGILKKNSRVLDIGCGPGKYAIAMAKECKEVIALDISKEMLNYLDNNIRKENLKNISTYELNWEDINLLEYGWEKKFDLVFASMTPAIYNFYTFKKMLEASRGYCYLSGFIQRQNNLWDILEKEILGENNIDKQKEDKIYYAFNILWNLGYHPEIIYEEKKWQQDWDLETIINLYIQRFEIKDFIKEKDKEKIRNFLSNHSKDGKIIEKTQAKIAALIWKI